MSDEVLDDLTANLQRVSSDLTFRQWVRRNLKWIVLALVLDIFASVTAVAAIIGVQREQDRRAASICSVAEAFTRSLLAQADTSPPQSDMDRFTDNLNERLAPYGCHIHIDVKGSP